MRVDRSVQEAEGVVGRVDSESSAEKQSSSNKAMLYIIFFLDQKGASEIGVQRDSGVVFAFVSVFGGRVQRREHFGERVHGNRK